MRLLQAPRHSLQHVSSPRDDSHSWSSELFAHDGREQMASRHDPQMLIARTVPADPYTVWLDQREADGRSSTVAAPTRPAGRFSRNQRTKAPWEAIMVTLSPDSR